MNFITDIKIVVGLLAVVAAVYSHFNGQEFPENKVLIAGCVAIYSICVGVIYLLSRFTEGNAFYVGAVVSASKRVRRTVTLAPKIWAYSTLSEKGNSMYTLQLRNGVKENSDSYSMRKPYESYFSEAGAFDASEFRSDIEDLVAKLGEKLFPRQE